MQWNEMSEQEKYYSRLNRSQESEDFAGLGALALIIAAIGFIFVAAQGLFLFIGAYFVVISCISGAFIGLALAKETLAEDPSDASFTYIFYLILSSAFFGAISYFIKASFFPDIGIAFNEFLSSWGF